eukprot:376878-Pelagomonas_calceolata.AAC.1
MADRTWEDQQSSDLELSRMTACKIFFIVELLHRSGGCKDALLLGTTALVTAGSSFIFSSIEKLAPSSYPRKERETTSLQQPIKLNSIALRQHSDLCKLISAKVERFPGLQQLVENVSPATDQLEVQAVGYQSKPIFVVKGTHSSSEPMCLLFLD